MTRQVRTQRERTEATRQALLDAARALFVARGYAATSTPEVAAAAGITRGALYHHYADKRDLFRQVLLREAAAVADGIAAAVPDGLGPAAALHAGAAAYLRAMTVPGRTRLLLVDAPAVLGSEQALSIDDDHAARSLREGLAALRPELDAAALDALAALLSAAFDRAALEIDAGRDPAPVHAAIDRLLRALAHGSG